MKILIIGQAQPAIKQELPYDTTLLYDMLSWVDIDKNKAQEMFEFDAISNKFPGFDSKGGHLKPSREDCDIYWNNFLESKVQLSNKIMLLGRAAESYFNSKEKTWSCNTKILYLPHPSRRNYSLIMKGREWITNQLIEFLK